MANTDIDFHSHILPCCDHGSDSVKTSVTQLRLASDANVGTVCATPHFYPDRDELDGFLQKRSRSYENLCAELKGDEPRILLGAEVLFCEGMEDFENIDLLCLQNSNLLLFEMPFYAWSSSLFKTVEDVCMKYRGKITPILAHADRYSKSAVERLLGYGVLLQLNVQNYSKKIKYSYLKDWVNKGYVVALGSDIHGTKDGYTYWNKAKRKSHDEWDKIMQKTANLISC